MRARASSRTSASSSMRAHTVSDPVRAEQVHGAQTCSGPLSSPACGVKKRPARGRDARTPRTSRRATPIRRRTRPRATTRAALLDGQVGREVVVARRVDGARHDVEIQASSTPCSARARARRVSVPQEVALGHAEEEHRRVGEQSPRRSAHPAAPQSLPLDDDPLVAAPRFRQRVTAMYAWMKRSNVGKVKPACRPDRTSAGRSTPFCFARSSTVAGRIAPSRWRCSSAVGTATVTYVYSPRL